jgi:hypothetical protein
LYDPFNTPHTQGNLQLGLQRNDNAFGGAAVINGQVAYFASGNTGGFYCYLHIPGNPETCTMNDCVVQI